MPVKPSAALVAAKLVLTATTVAAAVLGGYKRVEKIMTALLVVILLCFIVVAFIWTGFFVLEGYDFGVGVLHTVVGRDERERNLALRAIVEWIKGQGW